MDGSHASTPLEDQWWHGRRCSPGVPQSAGRNAQASRGSLFLLRDFDEAAVELPSQPVFSLQDVQEARQDGYDKGYASGQDDAAKSRAAFEALTIAAISSAMSAARADIRVVADEAANSLARTLIAAMELTMPDLIRRSAVQEIGAMVACILPGLSQEPEVHAKVAPEIADAVRASLEALPREDRDRIKVTATDDVIIGEAKLIWTSGHACRQPLQIWQQVMDALHVQLGESADKETGVDN